MPGPSGPRVFFIVFLFALPFTRPDTEAFRAYSPEAVHARLAQETGLQTVISVLEGLRFPDGLPAHCRRHSDSGTAPLCLSPDHLALPDVYVPFPTFLAEGAAPPPCGKAPYFPACPHVDGLGFKELADLAWHTAAMFFPNQTNPERLDPKAIANRSLVYWNIGVYSSKKGTDLMHLNRMLPHIDSHFFILHHNYDNPRFPNWLLDSPKVEYPQLPSPRTCPNTSPSTVPSAHPPHPLFAVCPCVRPSSCCALHPFVGVFQWFQSLSHPEGPILHLLGSTTQFGSSGCPQSPTGILQAGVGRAPGSYGQGPIYGTSGQRI